MTSRSLRAFGGCFLIYHWFSPTHGKMVAPENWTLMILVVVAGGRLVNRLLVSIWDNYMEKIMLGIMERMQSNIGVNWRHQKQIKAKFFYYCNL